MRVPPPSLLASLHRFIAVFMLGMLAGSIIFLYMHGQMMDKLLSQNRQLSIHNLKLSEENQKLEKEISKKINQKLLIKAINIKIVRDGEEMENSFTELEVLDRLHKELKFLIDLPLDSVAETADSIVHLVNGKRYVINQQEVSLHVEALVIYTTLTLLISIQQGSE